MKEIIWKCGKLVDMEIKVLHWAVVTEIVRKTNKMITAHSNHSQILHLEETVIIKANP